MPNANYVYEFEGDSSQPFGTDLTYKSYKIILPKKITFNCGRIIFTPGELTAYNDLVKVRDETIKRNKSKIAEGGLVEVGGGTSYAEFPIAGDGLETVPAEPTYSGDDSLTFNLYADGTLKFTKTMYNTDVFKITGGYKSRIWEYEVIGNVYLQSVALATSVRELKGG